jgi:hypothetical protein
MMIIALDSRRLAARRFDDEMAVIDLRGRVVHTMNVTASHLWEFIGRGTSFDELVQSLCDAFDVDVSCAERDVTAFLATLQEAGLVTTR